MIPLAVFEAVIDASGVAPQIEALLPTGVRRRQLTVRTLLAGMCLAAADHRPAHLTRVHQALTSLPGDDQRRLGVTADWKNGPHLLTYRQTEYTFGLVADAVGKDEPDGLPSDPLQHICDALLEASVPGQFKDASASLAVDWTDLESFSRPPPRGTSDCADPEASWGHRKNNLLRSQDELFYGWYLSAGVMARRGERARRPRIRPPRHGIVVPARPGPRLRPSADRAARPRGSRSATSSTTPATRTATPVPGHCRSARPGRSSSRTCTRTTAAPRAPTTAPSSPTGTCTARAPPAPCRNSGRWPAPPPKSRLRTTTARPLSSPATSSAGSPATTPTATTASPAPPPRARSAARCGPPR